MIRQADMSVRKSLSEVWSEAEQVRQHPNEWWAKEFVRFDLVARTTQFSHRPVPANKWFIDWGMPRKRYGGYELVDVRKFGKTCQTKLAPALCPNCLNAIFSLLLKESHQTGYPLHTRRQCVLCGYYEDITLRRDGEAEGTIVLNGHRHEIKPGMRDWLPASA